MPAWFDLFDPMQMENVCERVSEVIEARLSGLPDTLSEPLVAHLLVPLRQFIETLHPRRLEWEASISFAHTIRATVGRIECGPWTKTGAEEQAKALRMAWVEFIAMGAAAEMYWNAPRRLAASQKAAKSARKPEEIRVMLAAYDKLKSRHEARNLASLLALKTGLSAPTVRASLDKHRPGWREHTKKES